MQKPTAGDAKTQPAAAAAGAGAGAGAAAAAAPAAGGGTTGVDDSTVELCDSETGEPYHITFSLDSAEDRVRLCEFFAANGYVAIRNVLTPAECRATVAEMGADMRARSATATGKGSADVQSDGKLFDITDVNTYHRAPITSRYGMYTSVPLFTDQLTANRQNARVFDAVQLLYDKCGHEPAPKELLVNHDSCCFYRPTLPHMPTAASPVVPQPTWATGDGKDLRELHLDFHPTGAAEEHYVRAKRDALTYDSLRDFLGDNNFYVNSDGLQLAGVLNLTDNRVADGGFHCVPTFPHVYTDWCVAKGYHKLAPKPAANAAANANANAAAAAKPAAAGKGKGAAAAAGAAAKGGKGKGAPAAAGTGAAAAAAAGAAVDGAAAGGGAGDASGPIAAPAGVEAGSYHFSDADKTDSKFLGRCMGAGGITRVNVPAGALIIWDQRMAHGSRPNASDRARVAQFMKWFPKRLFTKQRLERRKKALHKQLTDNGWLTRVGLTEIGKIVFGW